MVLRTTEGWHSDRVIELTGQHYLQQQSLALRIEGAIERQRLAAPGEKRLCGDAANPGDDATNGRSHSRRRVPPTAQST